MPQNLVIKGKGGGVNGRESLGIYRLKYLMLNAPDV